MDSNDQLEALQWIKENNNIRPLAGNRFGDKATALEFIERLYKEGATNVIIDNIFDEEWRIKEDGGPYADTITVYLPTDDEKRKSLFVIFNEESEREGFDKWVDQGDNSVDLWWD